MRRVITTAFALAAFAAALLIAGGCQSPSPTPVSERPSETPVYAAVRDQQNDRIRKLFALETSGVLELRWTDEEGDEHFEPQIDIKLLYEQPRLLSLRMYKFDTVMWLGSDDEHYWLFDLISSDQKVAWIGEWEAGADRSVGGVLHPMTLLDLAGLFTMPATGTFEWSSERGAWMCAIAGRSGPIRAYFDPASVRPSAVETLDEDGVVRASSTLHDYMRVAASGMPPADYPRLPQHLEVHDVDGKGTAKVTFSGPTTEVDRARLERATNLDLLMQALDPDEVRLLNEDATADAGRH